MKKHFFKRLIIFMAICGLAGGLAHADLQYYPDPPHKQLASDEPGPMDEMIDLAKEGDPRAQLILGDLYEKGKGGVAKNWKEARKWFELSAMHGYGQSFIRLAAMAKHEGNPQEAWQWYTLAIDELDGDAEDYAIKARKEVTETAKLDRDTMNAARKDIRAWKKKRDEVLHDEKEPPAAKEEEKHAETAEQDDDNDNYQQERHNNE